MIQMTLAPNSNPEILAFMSAEPLPASLPCSVQALDGRAWLILGYPTQVARRVGYLFGLTHDEADDLAQDISLSALRMGETQLRSAWFFVTARNRAIDVLRARSREKHAGAADARATPDAEMMHLLRARVHALPARLRLLYHLWYGEGMSQREVAARMRISRSSVCWLHRSLLRRLGCPDEFLLPGNSL